MDDESDNKYGALTNVESDRDKYQKRKFPIEVALDLESYFGQWDGKRVIIVSNYYPPNFIGGAEIIAHNQGQRTM